MDIKTIYGLNEPNLFAKIIQLRAQVWPDFIRVAEKDILDIYERFPATQIALLDQEDNLLGIANSLPIEWHSDLASLPDEGVTWAINNADDFNANMLVGISVTIAKDNRNKGLSKILLQTMQCLAVENGFNKLLIPARPTHKKHYPLIPMAEYIKWQDPWLSLHYSLGAKLIKICERSAIVTASIKQWEFWTKQVFPGSGLYIVDEALVPIEVDHARNLGTYIEPNVWVSYD